MDRVKEYKKSKNIHKTATLGDVVILNLNNVKIGKNTYVNSGQLYGGKNCKLEIGDNCKIGYNVHIKCITHDKKTLEIVEKPIKIGNNVWICDNVFIKEGITIGNNVIIGANAVVTKNIEDNKIVAGVPARVIG